MSCTISNRKRKKKGGRKRKREEKNAFCPTLHCWAIGRGANSLRNPCFLFFYAEFAAKSEKEGRRKKGGGRTTSANEPACRIHLLGVFLDPSEDLNRGWLSRTSVARSGTG